jgi:hypothetical protein
LYGGWSRHLGVCGCAVKFRCNASVGKYLRKCCRSGRCVEAVMVGQFSEHDVKKFNDAKTAVSSRLGYNFLFGAEVLRRTPSRRRPCPVHKRYALYLCIVQVRLKMRGRPSSVPIPPFSFS